MKRSYFDITAGHVALLPALLMMASARADDARSFDARPEGEQQLGFYYTHSHAGSSSDNLLPLVGVDATFDTAVLQYRYYYSWLAQSGFVEFSVPQVELKAKDENDPFGDTRETGAGDPVLTFAHSLYGRSRYREDWGRWRASEALGWSLSLTLPLGEYHQQAAVSAGNNRYVLHPQLNAAFVLGSVQLETLLGATWFSVNDEYRDDTSLHQRVLQTLEFHASDYWLRGLWWSLDAVYQRGGRASIDHKWLGEEVNDWRLGAGLHYHSDGGAHFALVIERALHPDEGSPAFSIGKVSYAKRW